jgi:hypothetical protein
MLKGENGKQRDMAGGMKDVKSVKGWQMVAGLLIEPPANYKNNNP